jgi:hypothetical protein
MKRNYTSGITDSITYFVGIEIEKTPAYGMKTLFVVGIEDPYIIMELAREHECTHIYFGANQSFCIGDVNDAINWRAWEDMIYVCLDSEDEFWCTLDMDVREVEGLLESGLIEKRQFIPQISVKLPYLQQLGYNATIKIDDIGFKATNPGVWCHNLHDLLGRDKFTSWDQYGQDEIIK